MKTYLLKNDSGNTIELTADCSFTDNGEVGFIWSCEELDQCCNGIWKCSHQPVNPARALRFCKGYKLIKEI